MRNLSPLYNPSHPSIELNLSNQANEVVLTSCGYLCGDLLFPDLLCSEISFFFFLPALEVWQILFLMGQNFMSFPVLFSFTDIIMYNAFQCASLYRKIFSVFNISIFTKNNNHIFILHNIQVYYRWTQPKNNQFQIYILRNKANAN